MDFYYIDEHPVENKALILYLGDSIFEYGYFASGKYYLRNHEEIIPIKWGYK